LSPMSPLGALVSYTGCLQVQLVERDWGWSNRTYRGTEHTIQKLPAGGCAVRVCYHRPRQVWLDDGGGNRAVLNWCLKPIHSKP
jgi:hypothetical protein